MYLCRLCVLCLHSAPYCVLGLLGRDRVSEESASVEDAEYDVNISYHTETVTVIWWDKEPSTRDVQEEADQTPEAQWGRGAAAR